MSVGGSLRSTTHGYYFVRHLRSLIGVFFLSVGNLLAQDYTWLLRCVSPSGMGGLCFFGEVFCWLGNILYLCDVK